MTFVWQERMLQLSNVEESHENAQRSFDLIAVHGLIASDGFTISACFSVPCTRNVSLSGVDRCTECPDVPDPCGMPRHCMQNC